MIQLRLLLVLIACACAVARNMERREEHHHPLSIGDNSTHQHDNSTRPIADTPVDHRRAAEEITTSTQSAAILIEDLTSVLKQLEKKLNSSATTALHPNKRAAGPAVAKRRAEPGCCN